MSLENMMEPTGEMSSEQIGAIEHSIRIGSLLVIDHPEIAELYRDGMSYPGIAESLNVKREYGILSDKVAGNSIHYAITGHAGGFGTESYDGLIQNLDELATLEHEHQVESGRINGGKLAAEGKGAHGYNPETGESYAVEGGRKAAAEGKGAHGYNPETGESYAVEGGRIGGRKAAAEGKGVHGYNPETGERYVVEGGIKLAAEGKGVHGLTPEQRLENGRKATLAKGQTPWIEEETEYAHLLSLEPEFQHQKGVNKGKGDYKTIAQVLNEDYHNGEEVRSPKAVNINLSNYRKTLEN